MKFKIQKTCVPGLRLVENFITEEEENELIENINYYELGLNPGDKVQPARRFFFYGKRHVSGLYMVSEDADVKEYPKRYLQVKKRAERLLAKIGKGVVYNNDDSELFINEYEESSALRFHTDHRGTYEELIIGISLAADCEFAFKDIKTGKIDIVFLPRRSMYLMEGDSRYNKKHGILKYGIFGERRISLTFRKIKRYHKK